MRVESLTRQTGMRNSSRVLSTVQRGSGANEASPGSCVNSSVQHLVVHTAAATESGSLACSKRSKYTDSNALQSLSQAILYGLQSQCWTRMHKCPCDTNSV